jgi:hypothetical protein
MPEITDVPPAEVLADLNSLPAALDSKIPGKQAGQNLLIATWNPASAEAIDQRKMRACIGDVSRDGRRALWRGPGGPEFV